MEVRKLKLKRKYQILIEVLETTVQLEALSGERRIMLI
jgi:hypothetical protein